MTDLQVGGVRGFRLFLAVPGGRLVSYAADYVWEPGQNEATCQRRRTRERDRPHGPIPDLRCKCGFWIYQDQERCVRMFRAELLNQPRSGAFGRFEPEHRAVLGQASGWGRVLEGEDGWRSEYARIEALLDIGQGFDLRPWTEAYDVPPVLANVDLALVHTGRLTSLGEDVDRPQRTGIKVGTKLLAVRVDSLVFLQLWRIPLGTLVRVTLDPETREVAGVLILDGDDGDSSGYEMSY